MDKLIAIVNPKSGSAGDDFRARVEAALQERGAPFETLETTPESGGEDVAGEAIRRGATHLLACGGDGTIMGVVNGIGKAGVGKSGADGPLLSIVPGGTANLLATALGLPMDLDEAIAVAVSGQDRVLDLGRCADNYFALGVGLGLTERLVSQASAEEKEKLGKLAYAKAMLKELGANPHQFSFKLDGGPEQISRGVAIVIANSGDIGGHLKFAPNARMDDGLLDLCVLHHFNLGDLISMGLHTLQGDLEADPAVSFFQAQRIEITSDPPLDLQIDGEVKDLTTPLIAEVVPQALRVRVPMEN